MTTTQPPETSAPRPLLLTCLIGFVVADALVLHFGPRTGFTLFRPLALIAGWGALVSFAAFLPRLPFKLRPALILLAAVAVFYLPAKWYFGKVSFAAGVSYDYLRMVAVVLAIWAFVLQFLAAYGSHSRRDNPHSSLTPLISFARLLAACNALVVVTLLAQLYFQRNWIPAITQIFSFTAVVLFVEFFLHNIARLYQPKRLRAPVVLGHSVLLPALFGESGPLRSLAATLEKTFGVKLGDTWLLQLARALAAPLLLLGLVCVWLSTGVTRVPVDSRGVKLACGNFQSDALAPGLHFHAPWPWGRVEIVATERVQELSIGFDKDNGGPVLWTEKHYEGEQNLLVGRGEELLTINVPIHYRVKDAVAWLRHTSDAPAAIEALAYRELLTITDTHTAFGLMTTDREEVSAKLRNNLQAAADRLSLGVEIIFVGLKDIHPPVPVAPAYQDVISAEEQRIALVDQARTYAVQMTANAQITATQTRTRAESAATERLARAAGETSRFLAPLDTWQTHRDVFGARLKLETLETALGELQQLYVVSDQLKRRVAFLPPGSSAAPAASAAAKPTSSSVITIPMK